MYFLFICTFCTPTPHIIIWSIGSCSSSRLSSSCISGYHNLFIFFQFILQLNEKSYQINLFRKWAANSPKASVMPRRGLRSALCPTIHSKTPSVYWVMPKIVHLFISFKTCVFITQIFFWLVLKKNSPYGLMQSEENAKGLSDGCSFWLLNAPSSPLCVQHTLPFYLPN